jgi:CRISPR-associated protein Csb2
MSLILEIEYLTGACFAAISSDSDIPDWPVQPDRVFSALVATWGVRGENGEEVRALEWLERLPAPKIEASGCFPRTTPRSFVPPNDPKTGRSGDKTVIPSFRRRQQRKFPAARPYAPVMRLVWIEAEPDKDVFTALQRLATDTTYIGHSTSLTRCYFRNMTDAPASKDGIDPKRRVYPGRLAELQDYYQRFIQSNNKKDRPPPGDLVKPRSPVVHMLPHGTFAERWLLLEHVSGEMPDVRASAIVAKAIRDALLGGYKRMGAENRVPEEVSGHRRNGDPSRDPHLAIVPLTFTGYYHADGHVMGFALIPPHGSEMLDNDEFRQALRKIAPMSENFGRRLFMLKSRTSTRSDYAFSLGLSPTFEPPAGKRSLDPTPYLKPFRTFATVTPIVLDRHVKKQGEKRVQEIITQIKAALYNIGLPEPEAVVPSKHSAIEGAVSAWRSGNSPAWMNWRLPTSLESRQLVHAIIRFKSRIQGPVIVGAGRFVGLGLCRPLPDSEVHP